MSLTKQILLETVDKVNLKVTDKSTYDVTNPKSSFSSRIVRLTKVDGTYTDYNFPYTNTDNTIQDTLTFSNIFIKDLYLSILTTFTKVNTSVETYESNYLSLENSISYRNTLSNTVESCDNCSCFSTLASIDMSIETAKYAATYNKGIKAQKSLDKIEDVYKSLNNDCNCNG